MKYSKEDIMQYVKEEDVKFIRLTFCDVFGKQKNISIMPKELPRAFSYGIAFDASAVFSFGDESHSDMFLFPDGDTLMPLPWRPEHGKVVRMFSDIRYPDGTPFEGDTRRILKQAAADAEAAGLHFDFGAEQEFYLFCLDEAGNPVKIPYDNASYMDLAPSDRGENIRREVCLTLERMGISPESSHHEEGPGQNEIDFRYSDALTAADNALTFRTIVETVARSNGLWADFGPKPMEEEPGNGFHINMSVKSADGRNLLGSMTSGVLEKISEITAFLNPVEDSYRRFGGHKAPEYISWSRENRSQLVRIPAAVGEYRRAELRSPDPAANPYLAFALLIYAGMYGIERKLQLPPAADFNLHRADQALLASFDRLPVDLKAAAERAFRSDFVKEHLPEVILNAYCRR